MPYVSFGSFKIAKIAALSFLKPKQTLLPTEKSMAEIDSNFSNFFKSMLFFYLKLESEGMLADTQTALVKAGTPENLFHQLISLNYPQLIELKAKLEEEIKKDSALEFIAITKKENVRYKKIMDEIPDGASTQNLTEIAKHHGISVIPAQIFAANSPASKLAEFIYRKEQYERAPHSIIRGAVKQKMQKEIEAFIAKESAALSPDVKKRIIQAQDARSLKKAQVEEEQRVATEAAFINEQADTTLAMRLWFNDGEAYPKECVNFVIRSALMAKSDGSATLNNCTWLGLFDLVATQDTNKKQAYETAIVEQLIKTDRNQETYISILTSAASGGASHYVLFGLIPDAAKPGFFTLTCINSMETHAEDSTVKQFQALAERSGFKLNPEIRYEQPYRQVNNEGCGIAHVLNVLTTLHKLPSVASKVLTPDFEKALRILFACDILENEAYRQQLLEMGSYPLELLPQAYSEPLTSPIRCLPHGEILEQIRGLVGQDYRETYASLKQQRASLAHTPLNALELAKAIHVARKDAEFWKSGLTDLLKDQHYKTLLDIAKADIEAAKIFLGSYSICQQLTALQKAQIIHHHRQHADFLTQLSKEDDLLALAQTSLQEIGKQNVDATRLLLSSAEIMQQLSPQKKAEMLWHHRHNPEFFQDINALLAQTGTSLLDIAKADPVGAGTILGTSKLNLLFKPQALEKALTDPQFALEFFPQSPAIWGRLLTTFEKAVLIIQHRDTKFTDKNAPVREESFLASLLKDPNLNPSENSLLVKIAIDDPRAAQLFLMSETIRQLLGHNAEGIIQHWRREFEQARANRPANLEFRQNLAEVQKFIQEYGESPYRALGVARDASPEQIRETYRAKNLANHPDRDSNNQTQAKLTAANAILIDVKKREILDKVLKGSLGDFEARLITVHFLADPAISQQAAANPQTTTALNAKQSALINRFIEELQTEDESDELPPEKTTAINALEALKTYTALGIELNQAIQRISSEYALFILPQRFYLRIVATLAIMLNSKAPAAVNAIDLSAKPDSEKAKLLVKEKPDITNQGISRSNMIVGALVFGFALLCACIAIALTATGVFSPIGALFGITSLGTMTLLAANGALGFGAGIILGGLLASAYSLFKDSSESAQASPVKTTTPAMPKRETTPVADSAVQGEQYGHVLHRTAPPPAPERTSKPAASPKPQP